LAYRPIIARQAHPKDAAERGALERACYLMASRPKARHQVADFCSAPLAGYYAAVDIDNRHFYVLDWPSKKTTLARLTWWCPASD